MEPLAQNNQQNTAMIRQKNAIMSFIKFGVLFALFFIASIATAMVIHSVILLLQGSQIEGIITTAEPPRFCLLSPNFQCTLLTLEFRTKNDQIITFKNDMTFNPLRSSSVPAVYFEDIPKIASVVSELNSTFITGLILLAIGWVGTVLTKPLKVLKEFADIFAYGILPILFPFTDKWLKTRPAQIIGLALGAGLLLLFLWALLKGIAVGLFWAPIAMLIWFYYLSYFGILKISNRFFAIWVVLLATYLYTLLTYYLMIF